MPFFPLGACPPNVDTDEDLAAWMAGAATQYPEIRREIAESVLPRHNGVQYLNDGESWIIMPGQHIKDGQLFDCHPFLTISEGVTFDHAPFTRMHGITRHSTIEVVLFHKSHTHIPNGLFWNCTHLEMVEGMGIEHIGSSAFGNTSLKKHALENVKTIGDRAFMCCNNFQTISFPKATVLGRHAFWMCNALITAHFPACTQMGNLCFEGCALLTTVTTANGAIIPDDAFLNCPRHAIDLPPLQT